MYLKKFFYATLCSALILCIACSSDSADQSDNSLTQESIDLPKGKLFIIGGGKRPPELIQELLNVSNLDEEDEIVILPMSSSEPDTAIFYATKQFTDLGIPGERIQGLNFKKDSISPQWIDQLAHADLIYISGGNQSRFMDVALGTAIQEAIQNAYHRGATVAGTSAGAAVMSQLMITGDERKHSDNSGSFRTIESNNIILTEGIGLIKNAIIDQHFIYRKRLNRLISVAIEHPEITAIGIDESTAIIVDQNQARVVGLSQVILLKSNEDAREQNGLLGADDIQLSVKLPGDTFSF
jgi:cyanophycinase